MRLLRSLAALALLGVCGPLPAAGPKVNRFAGGEASRFASAYWFLTERGSFLVDAPFLAAEAATLEAEMAAAGALPVGAALLTGGRPERSWGLGLLVSPATRVWGSRATAALIDRAFAIDRERFLRMGLPLAEMPRIPPHVTNAFTGSMNLGFEGYTLRLLEVGEDASVRTTAVYVPETGELFAGGLIWNGVHPETRGADLGAWRRALEDLGGLHPRVVYPGYGGPGGVELLERMADYLGDIGEVVRPLTVRPSLSVREVESLGRSVARKHRRWLLPGAIAESLRAEHRRLRRLLVDGE